MFSFRTEIKMFSLQYLTSLVLREEKLPWACVGSDAPAFLFRVCSGTLRRETHGHRLCENTKRMTIFSTYPRARKHS